MGKIRRVSGGQGSRISSANSTRGLGSRLYGAANTCRLPGRHRKALKRAATIECGNPLPDRRIIIAPHEAEGREEVRASFLV